MSLLIDGKPIPGTERVRENIVFRPGQPNTRTQTMPWHGFGLHWTGAENASSRVIQTLTGRRLSVQLIGEKDGELVQTADLNTVCAHIGSPGNQRFLGIEMIARGFATKEDYAQAKARDPSLRDRDELDWSEPRDCYRDTIGGHTTGLVSFAPKMIENMLWLCETLAARLHFPRAIPWRKVVPTDALFASLRHLPRAEDYVIQHAGAWWLPSFDRDITRYGRAAKHRGVLGHFHIHDEKYDPGTQPFWALWAEGWNPAGKKLPGALR